MFEYCGTPQYPKNVARLGVMFPKYRGSEEQPDLRTEKEILGTEPYPQNHALQLFQPKWVSKSGMTAIPWAHHQLASSCVGGEPDHGFLRAPSTILYTISYTIWRLMITRNHYLPILARNYRSLTLTMSFLFKKSPKLQRSKKQMISAAKVKGAAPNLRQSSRKVRDQSWTM